MKRKTLIFFALITAPFIAKEVIDMNIFKKVDDKIKEKRWYELCLRNDAIFNVGIVTAMGFILKDNRKVLGAGRKYIRIELFMDIEQKQFIELACRDYLKSIKRIEPLNKPEKSEEVRQLVWK